MYNLPICVVVIFPPWPPSTFRVMSLNRRLGKDTHHIQKIHMHNGLPNVLGASACTFLAGTLILSWTSVFRWEIRNPSETRCLRFSLIPGSRVQPLLFLLSEYLPTTWRSLLSWNLESDSPPFLRKARVQRKEWTKGMNSFLEPFYWITQGHHF